MDAVTYPTGKVVQLLNESFVCFSVDTARPGEDGKRLLRAYRLLWSPGFVFTDHRGTEVRRVIGYRPPDDFMAELNVVLGLVDLLHGRNAEAADRFHAAAASAPAAETAPEALYWAAVGAFRRDGRDKDALRRAWDELAARYPESVWSRAADIWDAVPTGARGQ